MNNIIGQQENFLPIEESFDFWEDFAEVTGDEYWHETIERLNAEGLNVQMIFFDQTDYAWPSGLLFGSAAEKLKFILKYSR